MLKPQKKITKKEIKEDKLVTTYFEARSWMEENKRLLGYIIGIPAGILVLGLLWNNNVQNNNRTASTQLAKVFQYYDQANYEKAIHGVPEENVRGLQAIVDDFGSTQTGEIAKLYLANSYFALGNFDKALEYYLDVDLSDRLLMASALAGAAVCYELKGSYEDAATYFERAASKDASNLTAPDNLHHAAANYSLAGKKERAMELLKKLKKEFPESPYARDIDRYIAQYGS